MTEYKKWLWRPRFFYKRGGPRGLIVPHDYEQYRCAVSWGRWTIDFTHWGWYEGEAND